MHFSCYCGHVFRDNTDNESFKGCIVADQDYGNLCRELETSDICDTMIKYADRAIFQCPDCGSIFIEDDGKFCGFKPVGEVNRWLLTSVEGENWRGFLYGEWYDEKPEWMTHNGEVYAKVNIPVPAERFDELPALEKRFYELKTELEKRGVLRCAVLNINGKRTFFEPESR